MSELALRTIPRLDQSVLPYINDNFEALRQQLALLPEVQWGQLNVNFPNVQAAAGFVTFPRPFRGIPIVVATVSDPGADICVSIGQGGLLTNTLVQLRCFATNGLNFTGNVQVHWHAYETA